MCKRNHGGKTVEGGEGPSANGNDQRDVEEKDMIWEGDSEEAKSWSGLR